MFNQNQMYSSFPNNNNYYGNPNANWGNFANQNQLLPSQPKYNTNFKKPSINWNGILNGTQKTLNIVNQAIPVFYQVKPIWSNAKTMLKVFGEFSKVNKAVPSLVTQGVESAASAQQVAASSAPNFFV